MSAANIASTSAPLAIAIQNSPRLHTKSFANSRNAIGSVARPSHARGPAVGRRIARSIRSEKKKGGLAAALDVEPLVLVVAGLRGPGVLAGLEGLTAAARRDRVRVAKR